MGKAVYILSIGLNVGAQEPAAQLQRTIESVGLAFGPVLAVQMGASEWEGVPERFIQLAVLADGRDMPESCALLARHLRQDAVAFISGERAAAPAPGYTARAYWNLAPSAPGASMGSGGSLQEFPVIVDYPSEF